MAVEATRWNLHYSQFRTRKSTWSGWVCELELVSHSCDRLAMDGSVAVWAVAIAIPSALSVVGRLSAWPCLWSRRCVSRPVEHNYDRAIICIVLSVPTGTPLHVKPLLAHLPLRILETFVAPLRPWWLLNELSPTALIVGSGAPRKLSLNNCTAHWPSGIVVVWVGARQCLRGQRRGSALRCCTGRQISMVCRSNWLHWSGSGAAPVVPLVPQLEPAMLLTKRSNGQSANQATFDQ